MKFLQLKACCYWGHIILSQNMFDWVHFCERNSFQAPILTVCQGLNALRRVIMCTLSNLCTSNGQKYDEIAK